MSPEMFPNLESVLISDLDPEDRDCSICLLELEAHDDCNGTAGRLRCRHIFGRECLLTWLEDSLTCPTCRADVDYLWADVDTWRFHKSQLRSWREARAYLRERLDELRDERSEPVGFFRGLVELVLAYTPETPLPQCDMAMAALIGTLEAPLYDDAFTERDEDEENYERRYFLWHLERVEDVLQGFSDGGYNYERLYPQADNFEGLARMVRAEVGNRLERLRWDVMPDYGLEILFGGDLEE